MNQTLLFYVLKTEYISLSSFTCHYIYIFLYVKHLSNFIANSLPADCFINELLSLIANPFIFISLLINLTITKVNVLYELNLDIETVVHNTIIPVCAVQLS